MSVSVRRGVPEPASNVVFRKTKRERSNIMGYDKDGTSARVGAYPVTRAGVGASGPQLNPFRPFLVLGKMK